MNKKAIKIIIIVGMAAVFVLLVPVFALMIAGIVRIEPVKFSEELAKGALDLFRLVFSIALGTYLLGFLKENYTKVNKTLLIGQLQSISFEIVQNINLIQKSIREMDSDKLSLWQKEFKKLQLELSKLIYKILQIIKEEPDSALENILKTYKSDLETHFNAIYGAIEKQDGIIFQSEINEESALHLKAITDWCDAINAIEKE